MKHLFRHSLLLALALAILPVPRATAANWVGNTVASDWGTPANWSPAIVPGPGDDAFFTNPGLSASVDLNGNRSINSLTFNLTTPISVGGFSTPDVLTLGTTGSQVTQNSVHNVVIHSSVMCGATCTMGGTGTGKVSFWGQFLGSPDLIINGPGNPVFALGSSTTSGGLTLNSITVTGGTLQIGNSNAVTVLNPIVVNGGTLNLCNPGPPYANLTAPSVTVNAGGTLLGNGTIIVTAPPFVTVGSGIIATLSPGCSPDTLYIVGGLILGANASLQYELATPGVVGGQVNDLTQVTGDLTLDGTLNVTPLAGFGAGIYRLFNYTGTLIGPGLTLGSLPSGYSYAIHTMTAGQVNLIVSTPVGQSMSYTNTLPSGYSLIANQLDHGSNTLEEIFPNMPDGGSLTIYSRTNCDDSTTYTYDSGFGGWIDESFNPIAPGSVAFAPGFAAFFFNPGPSTTLTFTGTPHVPVLPVGLPCGYGHSYFLSRQTNGPGTYENITGLPPTEGALLLRWTGVNYQTNLYTGGQWQPASPVVNVGEGVMIYVPPANVLACCEPPAQNRVVNGSFESPALVSPNSFQSFSSVPGWTGTASGGGAANIELWKGNFGSMTSQSGQQHLEINSSIADETVSQVVMGLTPGCPATVCFWHAGRPGAANNTFRFELSGAAILSVTLNPPQMHLAGWQFYSTTFTPASSTLTIKFTGASAPGYTGGAHIDSVCLTQITPILTCASNKTVACGVDWSFDPPAFAEGCCSNFTITVVGTVTNSSCPWNITRTWLATDSCGYSNICSQTVTVVDINPPTLSCPTIIRVPTCSTSTVVRFQVSANDACDQNVQITCVPPSGFEFSLGTTPVLCTAVDDCGNTSTCTFPVVVFSGSSFWQFFPSGQSDCHAWPNESSFRGACLNSAYPTALWKNFDDPERNRIFGHTWNLPPSSTYLDGWLFTRMKDYNCLGGSDNDTISLGLQNCTAPTWAWGRPLRNLGTDLGLPSTDPWCNIPDCGPEFRLHLSDLPPLGNNNSVVGAINAPAGGAPWARRLDMLVQDDTRVDYANLWLRRCPPQHIIGGLEATLTNAVIAYGLNSWSLMADPELGAPASYGATLALDDAQGAELELELSHLIGRSNGVVEIRFRNDMPDGGSHSVGWRYLNDGSDQGITITPVASSASGGSTFVLRKQGVTVLTRVFGPGVLPTSFTGGMPDNHCAVFSGGTNATLRLMSAAQVTGSFGTVEADEITFTVLDEPQWLRGVCPGYVDVTANVSEVSLSHVRIGATGIVDPADGQHDDWFATITGDALARVENGQLTVSALGDPGSARFIDIEVLGSGFIDIEVLEFRATIATTFGQFSPMPSNATVRFITRGTNFGGGQPDDYCVAFFSAPQLTGGWGIAAASNGVPAPLVRAEVWSHGTNVTVVMNPTSVSVSELPRVYWPSTTWFVDDDICHRFPYGSAVTVWIDGTEYRGTDLRVLTGGPGDDRPFQGLRVETVGAEALVLSGMETGPARYRLERPVLEGGAITFSWGGPGHSALESAPTLNGPWTPVPVPDGERRLTVPTTGPSKFFRARGN